MVLLSSISYSPLSSEEEFSFIFQPLKKDLLNIQVPVQKSAVQTMQVFKTDPIVAAGLGQRRGSQATVHKNILVKGTWDS